MGTSPSAMRRVEPEPGPGQVRVRVSVCRVCRTDLHLDLAGNRVDGAAVLVVR